VPLGQQQPGDELRQFPQDVKRGTTGDPRAWLPVRPRSVGIWLAIRKPPGSRSRPKDWGNQKQRLRGE
jgi:hypothetical protein